MQPTRSDKPLYVAFLSGLTQEKVPIKDGNVTIPSDLRGQVYAVLSKGKEAVDDLSILAGAVIMVYEFDEQGIVVA